MLRRIFLISLICCTFSVYAAPKKQNAPAKPKAAAKQKAPAKPKVEEPPNVALLGWSLRDHYSITAGKAVIDYAVENSDWRVTVNGIGTVVDNVSFRIKLADGTVLDPATLGKAGTERETTNGTFGKYTKYWSEYPAYKGLVVRHNLISHAERPFFLVQVEIGNVGTAPVEIASIDPVVLDPQGINMGAGAVAQTCKFCCNGMCPTAGSQCPPMLTIIDNTQSAFCFSLGVFPQGEAESRADFSESGGKWNGRISCAFNPSVRLDPGKKIASAPAWMTTAATNTADVDVYYAWAISQVAPRMLPGYPESWVTVPAGTSEEDFYGVVRSWAGTPLSHALVPGDWEGRPGSLEGATPLFQKNIGKVADQIRKFGLKPAITLDPMLAGGDGDGASSDGRKWYNLSDEKGLAKASEHYKKLNAFDVYVVQPTAAPDEVLKAFNMTRRQAVSLATTALQKAFPDKNVLPASAGPLKPVAEDWMPASTIMTKLGDFNTVVGPAQVAPAGNEAWPEDVIVAMAAYPGPLEVVGQAPGGQAERSLTDVLKRHKPGAQPVK